MTIEITFLLASLILLVAIFTSKLAARSGLPVLLLFLVLGMVLGSEGLVGIQFDNAQLSQSIGVVALVVILFAGGLDTRWQSVAPVLKEGLLLSTIGVAITAGVLGLFAAWILQLSLLQGLLLGSIVSSTDAAAVFSILRSRGIKLFPHLKATLELESGSNDPMAVLLTIGMIQLITGEVSGPLEILPTFVLQMAIGAGLGIVFGRIALMIINRINLEYDGLYTVLSLALMLLTYGGTTVATGNGFLAVYIAGLVIARSDFIHRRSLIGFHDGLAWLMQIIMFLTLGLLVFPSNVIAVAPQGLLIALFLMVVARPISVFVALIPSKLTFRERVLLSWVGMRGAAPIILATFPLVAGLPSASIIFNVVFFVVLASVILQGTTISLAGRWLGLVDDSPDTSNRLLPELIDQGKIEDQLAEIVVSATSDVIGKQIIDLRLPPEVLMMLIQRHGEIVIPRGGTRLEANDRVLVLAPAEMRDDVLRLLTT